MDWSIYLNLLGLIVLIAIAAWLLSLRLNDVSFVDTLWSLMFLILSVSYYFLSSAEGPRAILVIALVAAWSIRLSIYITVRNHGQPEDHRYQKIRANNQPGFRFKSLYIVFGFQGVLAWIIAVPLVTAMGDSGPLGLLDLAAVALWTTGMFFETLGDMQLSRFRQDPDNHGKVLNTGLWRFTRHPNYFGEFTLWWGFYLLAAASGGWWTIFSPILMSILLLRVSGVTLLEKDIEQRRPEYASYIQQTNAFFPGPSRPGQGE